MQGLVQNFKVVWAKFTLGTMKKKPLIIVVNFIDKENKYT